MRSRFLSSSRSVVVALILAVGICLPSALAQQAEAAYGGELRIGAIGDIDNMDIVYGPSGIGAGVARRLVFDGLALLNPVTNEYEPRLAESWEILDDGLVWRFHLRQGVMFHNGEELTSDDVKYTFDIARDPAYESPWVSRFAAVADVIAVDKYTVDVILREPVLPPLAFQVWEHNIHPRSAYEADREGFGFAPIGTGPFVPVDWVRGLHMILEANEDYYLGRPFLDRVVLRVIPEPAARLLAFEAGELDLIMDVAVEDVPRLDNTPGLHLFSTAPNNVQFFAFFWNDPLVGGPDNRTVRHAVAHAINEEAVLSLYTGIGAVISKNILPPSTWGYNDGVPTYDYDPERAVELFAEAGWTRDSAGVLRNEAGQPFTIDLLTTPDRLGLLDTAQIIQENLQDVGAAVNIQSYEFTTYFDDMTTGNHQTRVARRNDIRDPDVLRAYFHSGSSLSQNRNAYANEQVDDLLERGLVELDPDAREQLYLEVQAILADDLPSYPMVATPVWLAVRDRFVLPDGMVLSHMADVAHFVRLIHQR